MYYLHLVHIKNFKITSVNPVVSCQMAPCAEYIPAHVATVSSARVFLIDVVLQAGLGRVGFVAVRALVLVFCYEKIFKHCKRNWSKLYLAKV